MAEINQLTTQPGTVSVWVMHLPPDIDGVRFGSLRQYWERAWREAGQTPPPGLLIVQGDIVIEPLAGGELRKLGLMPIPEDN